jgi:hypothetical protein
LTSWPNAISSRAQWCAVAQASYADETRLLSAEERDDFRPPQPTLDDDLSSRVDPVNLKPVLGEIETDCDSLHGGRLLSICGVHRRPRCGTSMPGAGAVHPIKNSDEALFDEKSGSFERSLADRNLVKRTLQITTGHASRRRPSAQQGVRLFRSLRQRARRGSHSLSSWSAQRFARLPA